MRFDGLATTARPLAGAKYPIGSKRFKLDDEDDDDDDDDDEPLDDDEDGLGVVELPEALTVEFAGRQSQSRVVELVLPTKSSKRAMKRCKAECEYNKRDEAKDWGCLAGAFGMVWCLAGLCEGVHADIKQAISGC